MFIALAFSLMLAAADPAPAVAPTATSSGPAVAAPKRDGSRVKCRREARANSRLPATICKTEAQWEADAEAARKEFNELQNKTQANPG